MSLVMGLKFSSYFHHVFPKNVYQYFKGASNEKVPRHSTQQQVTNDTRYSDWNSTITQNDVHCYFECHCAECHNAECHYA